MLKRVISLILSLVMVLGMMPVNLTAAAEEIPAEDLSVAETTAPIEEETVPTEAEPEETVFEENIPEVTSVTGEVQTEYAVTYDAGITASGTCGANLIWVLDNEGTLTISGSGPMNNFSNNSPWNNYLDTIITAIIEDGVTSIGDYAFCDCDKLTSISIPNSVESIGEVTFGNCHSLISVTIPAGVNNIPFSAFTRCNSLTNITLPDSLKSIENYAFNSCSSLISITIPEGIRNIGVDAFENCTELREIYFSGSAPSFEKEIFRNVTATAYYPSNDSTWNCNVMLNYGGIITWESYEKENYLAKGTCGGNLTWKLSEDRILTISGSGPMDNFTASTRPWKSYASSISSVYIESGVTSIGDYAFYDCKNMSVLSLQDGMVSIGNNSFYCCEELISVIIPYGVVSIGYGAFERCNSLTYLEIPNSVTNIGSSAFADCDRLTSVEIPNSVTSIGDDVFCSCDRLTSVIIPNSVTNIGDYAFCYCYSLKNLIIPDSVTQIGKWAFLQCESLECIDIPNSVTSIGEYSFNSCYNLKSVTIGNSVTRIDKYAFGSCNNLENVVIGNSVARIGISVFYDCNSMTSMEIPNSVTSIGGYAFQNSGLTEIKFEGDTPSFGSNVFNYVTATAYYPAGNETWTEEVMQDYGGDITWVAYEIAPAVIASGTCGTNLTWMLDDEGKLTVSGEGFATWSGNAPWYDYRDSVKTVVLGDGVTGIVSNAFSRYGNLKCVQLSDTVEYIGPYAFAWCENLTDVTMGSAVTEIGEAAFRNCGSLTYITIPATVRSIGMNAFAYCEKLSGITVDEANTYYSSGENGVLFNEAKTRLLNCPGALTGTYTIPDSVTEIATCAFSACVNLTGVEIPDSVRVIESYAFDGCTGLTEIAIPASVTTLGTKTFDHCAGLQKIRFEGNAPKHFAGNKVVDLFGNTTATVYYPADDATWTEAVRQNYGGTISWKPYCVGEHTEVTDKAVEATCTSDGKTEGKHCSVCGEVLVAQEVIPAGHTEVIDEGVDATCTTDGKTEGKHCSACGEVLVAQEVIPAKDHAEVVDEAVEATCTTDGKTEGKHCSACGEVLVAQEVIPAKDHTEVVDEAVEATCTSDGKTEGKHCSVCGKVLVAQEVIPAGHNLVNGVCQRCGIITGTCGTNLTWTLDEEGTLTISGTGAMKSYEGFGDAPWYIYANDILSVVIEDGVTNIGSNAFNRCGSMTSVNIPDSVTTIESSAFNRCIALTSIAIPDSVTSIEGFAFYDCRSLTTVTIPDSVTVIENLTFALCDGLTSIIIPDSITKIGYEAFRECTGLIEIVIPDSVKTIDEGAFYYCTNLRKVVIPNSVKTIGEMAFSGCTGLTEIVIPDSVTSIGNYAFYYCTSLREIVIPESVTTIGSYAFAYCTGLMEITFEGNAPSFDSSAFYGVTTTARYPYGNETWTKNVMQNYGGKITWKPYCVGEHTEVTDKAVEATCTTDGKTEGKHCSVCGEVLVAQEVIPGGHKFGEDGVCQTCGLTGGEIGEHLQWTLSADGMLTISGNGAMEDYAAASGAPWYSSRASVKRVVIGSGVTSVGDRAFYNCTALTEVSIGNTVTSIGSYAFRGCSALESVTIPASVTEIKASAFRACSALAEVTFKSDAPSVGSYAFNECAASMTVQCYEGKTGFDAAPWTDMNVVVNHVGQWIVDKEATCTTDGSRHIDCAYCQETITETIIGKHNYVEGICSVCQEKELIDSGKFNGMTWKLDVFGTLTISGNTSMGNSPWQKNHSDKILRVVIEEGITRIGYNAFQNCTRLTEIEIPESVTRIDDYAFYNCTGLTDVVIGSGVTSIGQSAFSGCTGLTEIVIPESVTTIGDDAFYGCTGLTEIVIPESVTTIGGYAFRFCSSLTDIVIPASVTTIGNLTFDGCSNLTRVVIPDSVTSIGREAFSDCSGLTEIVIPDSVTSIGNRAFYGCTSLTEIEIPDGVTSIGEYTFYNCSSLRGIEIPESVTSIGPWAFEGCTGLTNVTIGSGMMTIGNRAFYGCTGLTAIEIPDSVTTIGNCAFQSCSSLTDVTIGSGMTTIGDDAFYGCTGLTEIVIPESVTSIGPWAFQGCTGLRKVTIGSGVTTIETQTFMGCAGLTEIEIPDSVTSIGSNAFSRCTGLRNVTIGSGVTTVGDYAFWDCIGLREITFEGDAPVFSDRSVFGNVKATAYYPANNETWSSDVMKNYGGVITWMAACINGHSEVIDEGVEATCTTDGKTEGSHCSVCGTVLVEQETIPATGHANAQEVAEKASTCKTRGIKLHYHCEACGGDYLEKTVSAQAQTAEDLRLPLDETNHEGETEIRDALMESCNTAGYTGDIYCLGCQEKIETGEVIPPRHTLREVAEVAPTYDAEGTMAHYLCEKCGKLFADEAATEELTEEALRLEKLIPIPEQLAAAKPGDVVKLMADAAVDMAIVNEGVTLDLNGYTLTADYFVAFNGANVEDNSDDNTGLLKVPANRVMISKSNAQLPVWNGEGYVFSKVTYRKALVAQNEDMVKFAFMPQFQSVATELLKDGAEGNKVTVEVRVSWETIQGREYRNLVFNNDQVALGISSGGAFILTFSGFSQLNLTTDVAIEAVVYSETGVSKVSDAIYVDVTPDEA